MFVPVANHPMHFAHHGAVRGVTGSCHQLTLSDGQAVLVDCGLFQGAETSPDSAGAHRLEIDFPLTGVHALSSRTYTSITSGASRTCW